MIYVYYIYEQVYTCTHAHTGVCVSAQVRVCVCVCIPIHNYNILTQYSLLSQSQSIQANYHRITWHSIQQYCHISNQCRNKLSLSSSLSSSSLASSTIKELVKDMTQHCSHVTVHSRLFMYTELCYNLLHSYHVWHLTVSEVLIVGQS